VVVHEQEGASDHTLSLTFFSVLTFSSRQRDSGNQPDQTKARALEALEPIANKLLGLQVTSDPVSLGAKEVSVEEQVERLIREARDPKNLGSMCVCLSPSHLTVN
jgi:hypothetical protein